MKRIGLLLVLAGLAAAGIFASRRAAVAPLPAVMRVSPVNAQGCRDCHEEIVDAFASAPHSFTLRPGTDSEIVSRFAGRAATIGDDEFRFEQVGDELHFISPRLPRGVRVDWVFGSGHHALTPVSLTETSSGGSAMLQLHASWYPGDTLARTPGMDEPAAVLTDAGRYHGFAETTDCFGCHASQLPAEGEVIDFSRIESGVSCIRCHLGADEHVRSDGETALRTPWAALTALESINRCGECHRRADEFTSDELVPTNTLLIRFSPVGLALSRCFQKTNQDAAGVAGRRLDCVTCHDPHRPAVQSPEFYIGKCLECHGDQPQQAAVCAAEPMTSQCLDCHMPKPENDPHLLFTDHWIRIRRE
jgi:hypothetical protein